MISGRRTPNADVDVYLRDLTAGTTTLVSANVGGTDGGSGYSYPLGITPDGTKVTFNSNATDLGPSERGSAPQDADG